MGATEQGSYCTPADKARDKIAVDCTAFLALGVGRGGRDYYVQDRAAVSRYAQLMGARGAEEIVACHRNVHSDSRKARKTAYL